MSTLIYNANKLFLELPREGIQRISHFDIQIQSNNLFGKILRLKYDHQYEIFLIQKEDEKWYQVSMIYSWESYDKTTRHMFCNKENKENIIHIVSNEVIINQEEYFSEKCLSLRQNILNILKEPLVRENKNKILSDMSEEENFLFKDLFLNKSNLGWQCPRCNNIYSPCVMSCFKCNQYQNKSF